MPALTLDSNIYVSALIFSGKPLRIFEMGIDGRAEIAISDEILKETLGIMTRKFRLPPEHIELARLYIEAATYRVTPAESVNIASDPPDNRILECANAAGSEFIVSGDKHLLRLKNHGAAKIITAAELLELMEARVRSDNG